MEQFRAFNTLWMQVRKQTTFWDQVSLGGEIKSYEEFSRIPELTKEHLKNEIERLTRRDVKVTNYITTGGSTGSPLKLPVGDESVSRVRSKQAEGRAEYGIKYRDRCFLIWGHSAAIGKGIRPVIEKWKRKLKDKLIGYYRLSAYELGVDTLKSKFEHFIQFKPAWVCGYSSAVVAFARANWQYKKRIGSLQLKAVLCSAEMLSAGEAKELREFFCAPVALEYGAMEFGPIAYTHPDREGMYVMDDLLVEAIPTGRKNVYRLLVTSLYERPVPLIRYDIGDEVKIYDPHFRGGIIKGFDEVLGRKNDIISFSDGSAAHSEVVTHAIKTQDGVLSFQFHKWEDTMQLKLVVRPGINEEDVAQCIRLALISVNPGFSDTEIVFVEDVDVTSAGKRRWVVVYHENRKL